MEIEQRARKPVVYHPRSQRRVESLSSMLARSRKHGTLGMFAINDQSPMTWGQTWTFDPSHPIPTSRVYFWYLSRIDLLLE
jgi:hypothetical protein